MSEDVGGTIVAALVVIFIRWGQFNFIVSTLNETQHPSWVQAPNVVCQIVCKNFWHSYILYYNNTIICFRSRSFHFVILTSLDHLIDLRDQTVVCQIVKTTAPKDNYKIFCHYNYPWTDLGTVFKLPHHLQHTQEDLRQAINLSN